MISSASGGSAVDRALTTRSLDRRDRRRRASRRGRARAASSGWRRTAPRRRGRWPAGRRRRGHRCRGPRGPGDLRPVQDAGQERRGGPSSAGISRPGPRTGPAGGPRRGPAAVAATSARTSPRRTNRRPPSLMLCSRPARAQPPIVDGREMDVGGGQDLGGLGEGDPVGRGGHRQSVPSIAPDLDGFVGLRRWTVGARCRRAVRRAGVGLLGRVAVAVGRRRRRPASMPSSEPAAAVRRPFFAAAAPSSGVPSWPSPSPCSGRRRRDRLPDGPLAAQSGSASGPGVDAVDDLEAPPARRAVVVVEWASSGSAISRGAGACRTSGSRTPARAPTRTRSARRRARRGRRPAPAARWRSGPARTGWPGCC